MLPTTDVKTLFIKLQLVVVMINELYILQKLGLGDFLLFKNYIYKFMFLLWKTEFDNASRTSYTTDVSVSKNRFAHCCNMYLYMKNSMRIACGTKTQLHTYKLPCQ
jgi:hypothetical protein